MTDWMVQFVGSAIVALAVPVTLAWMSVSAHRAIQPDVDGWVAVRPTTFLYVIGAIFAIPMAIFLTALPFLAFVSGMPSLLPVYLMVGVPLAIGSWYFVYGIFIVRMQFNESGIEYREFSRRLFVEWREVGRIKYDFLLGAYASTDKGRLIAWEYFRGFSQLIDAAQRNNIVIDPILLRKLSAERPQ